jgi:hypothetical protein
MATRKRMHRVGIERHGKIYDVMYFDENGMSTLARTKSLDVAKKIQTKFSRYVKAGRPLKEEASVWKYSW